MGETYKVKLKCDNCNREFEVNIPHGIKVSAYTVVNDCPYCSCSGTLYMERDW